MTKTNQIAILLTIVCAAHGLSSSSTDRGTRRDWLKQSAGAAGVFLVGSTNSPKYVQASSDSSTQELPDVLRKISLAPLGKPQVFENKSLNLPLEELAARLTRDLTVGANGSGGYFLTGDLSTDIFKDDCVFADPTNNVASLSRYQNALRILFDPASSQIQLLAPLKIHADTEPKTISGRIRSRGFLQLPWRPYVSAYESDIVYTIDDETGLIARQDQVWDSKSPSKALQESFTPSSFLFNQPPPKSGRTPSPSEPKAVSLLFDTINGRRPNEYTSQERSEIEGLIEEIVDTAKTNEDTKQPEFQRELLPGRWMLVYLQHGPDGAGIDRRIPFPDFDFNDNYQVFGTNQVTNIGQVLGPWIDVKVSGTLQEEDPSSTKVPKRFQANIEGGKLCVHAGNGGDGACFGLPIQGEGIFDSLYLGDRLRIGQNINGGGARVVQCQLSIPVHNSQGINHRKVKEDKAIIMYDVPYDSCIHPDDDRSGVGYGYGSPMFDTHDGQQVDDENRSLQYSIQSNDQMQQQQQQEPPQPQLSDIDEIRRKALLLKQKFKMIGRYDDILDMDSLYSQSGCDTDFSILESPYDDEEDNDEEHNEIVNENSQHSFGSLYSGASSSQHEDSASDGTPDDSHLTTPEPSTFHQGSEDDPQESSSPSPEPSIQKFETGDIGTEPVKEASNEDRFNLKISKDPKAFCPREGEADADYSVSHGEIEDTLQELENEVNGVLMIENMELAQQMDQRKEQDNKDTPCVLTTTEQQALKERDAVSIQSFATGDSDDYGFSNRQSTHGELCRHELESMSTLQSEQDMKRSIDDEQDLESSPVQSSQEEVIDDKQHPESSPVQSADQEEVIDDKQHPESPPVQSYPKVGGWNSKQVEIFLNEYRSLHQRKKAEAATMESQIREHNEVQAEMMWEIETLTREGRKNQLELAETKESLGKTRNCLATKLRESENLMSENAKLENKNAELAVLMEKCKSDAAEQERKMKDDYQGLKESHMKISLTMEYKLARFQDLVNDLQEHSRKLEQSQGAKIKDANEKLSKQKRITNNYKKKHQSVCEKRDALSNEIKLQRKKILALEKQLKKQKTTNKNLRQRTQAEAATMESQIQKHIEVEADLKREIQTLIQKGEEKQLQLAETEEMLGEAKKYLGAKMRETMYLKSDNAKLENRNAELAVLIGKYKAAEEERKKKLDYKIAAKIGELKKKLSKH